MSKVTQVTVKRDALINIGNYENVRVGVEETHVLEEGDTVEKVREVAMKSCNSYIAEEVDAIELKQRRQASKAGRFGVL